MTYVHERFRRMAQLQPTQIALDQGDRTLTYGELAACSASVLRSLLERGLGAGSIIVIMSSDAMTVIAAIIGALEAGCVFVPLDPGTPQPRLAAMLAELEPAMLVCDRAQLDILAQNEHARQLPSLCLDIWRSWEEAGGDPGPVPRDGNDPAYVYYTSGSTGRPKGILGRLKGIDHFIAWEMDAFGVDADARVSHLTTPAFDASLRDIFTPLCAGGTVVIPASRRIIAEPCLLVRWLNEQRVTLVHCVPSIFRMLLNETLHEGMFPTLRHVVLAGEPLLPADVARWIAVFGTRIQLVNMYGPSETTMVKFAHVVSPSDADRPTVPIGKPIEGCRAEVVDGKGRPVAAGTIGEIYIRTRFCALGYHRQPELTGAAFFANPVTGDAHDLIYRTGDFGRVMEDGAFELLGRRDGQVKIGGVRVELAEIESALRLHSLVKDVAVIERDDGRDGRQLCAYVVAAEACHTDVMRSHLISLLPPTHIPAIFVRLDVLPRTITGKVDRKMLPSPPDPRAAANPAGVRPGTPIQMLLVEMWSQLLGYHDIGVTDDFFALGGHSLLATQLLARVYDALDVEIPLQQLLTRPTVEGLAEEIEERMRPGNLRNLPPLRPVRRDLPLPLSHAQQRLWVAEQLSSGEGMFNMTLGIRITGDVDDNLLRQALARVIKRHEALRTVFENTPEGPRPKILAHVAASMALHDQAGALDRQNEAELRAVAVAEASAPFDLEKGPLIRAILLRLDGPSHLLLVSVHHIVCDAWSFKLLVRELGDGYAALQVGDAAPPPLSLHYADFAAWQREWLTEEYLEPGIRYWRRVLAGSPPLLTLPTDRPRPAVQSFRGRQVRFSCPAVPMDGLTRLARQHHATPFMILFATFAVLLHRYSGQNDVVVGIPMSNRRRRELEDIIGFFADILVLRTDVGSNPSFGAFLAQVRKRTAEAYGHGDTPFERLVEAAGHPRSLAYSPLVQVAFGYEEIEPVRDDVGGVRMQIEAVETGTAKFDLFLALAHEGGQLKGVVEYRSDLFEEASIRQMLTSFEGLLRAVIADPSASVEKLPLTQAGVGGVLAAGAPTHVSDQLRDRIARLLADRAAAHPGSPQLASSQPGAVL